MKNNHYLITVSLFLSLVTCNFIWISRTKQTPIIMQNAPEQTAELFHPGDEWNDWNCGERLEWIRSFADKETEHLGLSHVQVVCGNLQKCIVGQYSKNTHTILIDKEYLENSQLINVLQVLCHETYHAYSYALIDLYHVSPEKYHSLAVFSRVKEYEAEFSNYENGIHDLERYQNQCVEQDADEYAQDRAYYYYTTLRFRNVEKII